MHHSINVPNLKLQKAFNTMRLIVFKQQRKL